MDVHVARQPILDRSLRTYGYEFLFRDGVVNGCSGVDPELATAKVIDTAFFVLGIEPLTGGRRAFVNFTRANGEALTGAQRLELLVKHWREHVHELRTADANR